MRKFILFLNLLLLNCLIVAQPSAFTWSERHLHPEKGSYNYISPAKDQKEQGPCNVFASVAAVEAMVQIFFNGEYPY